MTTYISLTALRYCAYKLSGYCYNHLGGKAKYFNIANVVASAVRSIDGSELDYLTVESSFVLRDIQEKMVYNDYALFTALIEASAKKAYVMVEDELSNNVKNMK